LETEQGDVKDHGQRRGELISKKWGLIFVGRVFREKGKKKSGAGKNGGPNGHGGKRLC